MSELAQKQKNNKAWIEAFKKAWDKKQHEQNKSGDL